jgi:uncharacterized repeat protein (TIGR03806 family)
MQVLPVDSPLTVAAARSRMLAVTLVWCSVVTLQACGGGGGGTSPPPQAPIASDTTRPSTPSGVSATATSASRVDLTWTASTDTGGSGLAGYRVYRDGATAALATVTTTTYADTSVGAGATYSYVVRAFDGAGNESEASTAAGATTPTAPTTSASGLDARPSNTTCLAWDRGGATIATSRYTSLTFAAPLVMLQAPGVDTHWYVAEKAGVVRRFSAANPTSATTVIDLTGSVNSTPNEAGLLGMAFHPNFPTDNRVFLSYTASEGSQLVSRISSFTSSDNGATFAPASEVVLLKLNQPEENHNGGHIAFGADGYLYIGFGDGGGGGDAHPPNGNGQRLTTLLGKMLRIDINVPANTRYAVPTTNPFFNAANSADKCSAAARDSGTCPEIFAYGFRNPWRWNFDRSNGDLWLADVGQNRYEEVNRVTLGGNYGWRCREGAHDYLSSSTPACGNAPTIDPLVEYSHGEGVSITGGYVYRGSQPTNLAGRYIFGDFGSGKIWAWIPENTSTREPTLLLESGLSIASFAESNDGELYVLDYGGTVHRIDFRPSGAATPTPTTLSATGCVNPSNPTQPTSGLIPYDVNAPFWSDGAEKQRWIGLPDGQNISVGTSGDWDFPNGTVLMKHFRNATRLIETRLFMRHPDGTWGGFTYEWNAQQTDATLVRGGAVRDIDGQSWIFPSEAQCMQCHTAVAGRALGLETAQLNRDFTYSHTNRTANELTTLSTIGTLTPPIADAASAPKMPSPADTSAPLANRARAYLHTNCSQCHRANGPTPSTIDLRYTTALTATSTCNVTPRLGDLGIGSAARLIAPGNAANSIVVSRMNRRDVHAMPPVGSARVDEAGVALVSEWVNSLSGC